MGYRELKECALFISTAMFDCAWSLEHGPTMSTTKERFSWPQNQVTWAKKKGISTCHEPPEIHHPQWLIPLLIITMANSNWSNNPTMNDLNSSPSKEWSSTSRWTSQTRPSALQSHGAYPWPVWHQFWSLAPQTSEIHNSVNSQRSCFKKISKINYHMLDIKNSRNPQQYLCHSLKFMYFP